MSKIGKKPIAIPKDVQVKMENYAITPLLLEKEQQHVQVVAPDKFVKHCMKEQKTTNKEKDFYVDEQGRVVFTEAFLEKRGFCCGNNCRHCPYNKNLKSKS